MHHVVVRWIAWRWAIGAGVPESGREALAYACTVHARSITAHPQLLLDHSDNAMSELLKRENDSMASANMDVVRPIYEAWDRGDFSSAEWAHPEIEFVMPDGVSPTQARGIDEMAAAWRSVLSAWTDFSVKAEAYQEIDETRILVLTRNRGRGKSSGVHVGEIARGANVLHVHDGKVTRLVAYWERDHAFADLGLRPPASSD